MEAPFSEGAARPIVLSLVKRQLPLFRPYPQIGADDLVQEVMGVVEAQWPKFPASAALSTCIFKTGRWRLNTIRRGLDRQKKRDQAIARLRPELPTAEPSIRHEHDAEDLVEWLANIHRMIRRNFVTYGIPLRLPKARHDTFDRAQLAAIIALQVHKKLSFRGTVLLLRYRPDLVKALGLPRVPVHSVLVKARKSGSLISFAPRKLTPFDPSPGG